MTVRTASKKNDRHTHAHMELSPLLIKIKTQTPISREWKKIFFGKMKMERFSVIYSQSEEKAKFII